MPPSLSVVLSKATPDGRRAATDGCASASATTCALLGERVSERTRGAANAGHTERALSAVDIEYARHRPAEDPEWTYRLDEDEITVMAGRCYVELKQPNRAIPLLALIHVLAGRSARASWRHRARTALAQHTWNCSSQRVRPRGDDRVTLLVQRLSPYRTERRAGR